MKKLVGLLISILALSMIVFTGCGNANTNSGDGAEEKKEYKYYTADELKAAIEENKDVDILDIQVQEEFNTHHIKGAIATYSYPVKTDEDKAKIDDVFDLFGDKESDIVIICPRGAGGAERTYDYLLEKGVKEDRLYILENGQAGWEFEELLEK